MFIINYYETPRSRKPVEEFLDSLSLKMKAKAFGCLELLEEHGPQLTMPFSKHLEDGIFELRVSQRGNIVRILYFFVANRTIILTHGFVKKSQKTPRREIQRAKKIRDDWKKRYE